METFSSLWALEHYIEHWAAYVVLDIKGSTGLHVEHWAVCSIRSCTVQWAVWGNKWKFLDGTPEGWTVGLSCFPRLWTCESLSRSKISRAYPVDPTVHMLVYNISRHLASLLSTSSMIPRPSNRHSCPLPIIIFHHASTNSSFLLSQPSFPTFPPPTQGH